MLEKYDTELYLLGIYLISLCVEHYLNTRKFISKRDRNLIKNYVTIKNILNNRNIFQKWKSEEE